MGKRKFNKPDDSDSEYEWEESQPKVSKSPEIKKPEIIKNDNELSGFLNLYTTKSNKEIRQKKKDEDKEVDEKLLKDRMCVPENVEPQMVDNNWLRRVYKRAQEQSRSSGNDVMSLLRERYDEKTINSMMKICGGRYSSSSENKTRYNRDLNERNNDRDQQKKHVSPNTFQNVDNTKDVEERYVTMVDLNEAAAALLKAEMSGISAKVSKLKKRLEILREAQRRNLKIRLTRPKKEPYEGKSVMIEKAMKNERMVPYVDAGNRFTTPCGSVNSSSKSIYDLLREEDAITADDGDLSFATVAGRVSKQITRYEDAGDLEYAGVTMTNRKVKDGQDKKQTIAAHKRLTSQVSNCKRCYKGLMKHLILSKGEYFCLIVPPDLGIIDCHWQLVPLTHIAASTRLDDDSWAELIAFKKQIRTFFNKELRAECVFMETVVHLSQHPHTVIDCIPLSVTEVAYCVSNKVFFKKAIDEAKSEWCQNRKTTELVDSDIRRTVPKGFPYFAVEFEDGGGLAFVIDDECKFSDLFGLEIVGSLLDKSQIEIRDRREKTFNEQADTVLRAEKRWKGYDLWRGNDSDDDDD